MSGDSTHLNGKAQGLKKAQGTKSSSKVLRLEAVKIGDIVYAPEKVNEMIK